MIIRISTLYESLYWIRHLTLEIAISNVYSIPSHINHIKFWNMLKAAFYTALNEKAMKIEDLAICLPLVQFKLVDLSHGQVFDDYTTPLRVTLVRRVCGHPVILQQDL